MKLPLFSLVALALTGCVSGTASDGLSLSQPFAFPAAPMDSPSTTISDTQPFDVSSTFSSLGKFGTVNLSVLSSTLTGDDLSLVQHIKMTLATTDGVYPMATLIDTDVSATNGSTNLPIVMDNGTLTQYLSENGGVQLTLFLTGVLPSSDPTLTWSLDADIKVSISKSVSDIGH
jgi:hypothetical protein